MEGLFDSYYHEARPRLRPERIADTSDRLCCECEAPAEYQSADGERLYCYGDSIAAARRGEALWRI